MNASARGRKEEGGREGGQGGRVDREELREGEREGAAECVDPSPSPVRGEHLLPAEEFLKQNNKEKKRSSFSYSY